MSVRIGLEKNGHEKWKDEAIFLPAEEDWGVFAGCL